MFLNGAMLGATLPHRVTHSRGWVGGLVKVNNNLILIPYRDLPLPCPLWPICSTSRHDLGVVSRW